MTLPPNRPPRTAPPSALPSLDVGAVRVAGRFVLRGRALSVLEHAIALSESSLLRGQGLAHAGDVRLADGRALAFGAECEPGAAPRVLLTLLSAVGRVREDAVWISSSDYPGLRRDIARARAKRAA